MEGVAAYWDFGFSAEDCILGSVLAEASGEGLVQRSVVGGVGFNGNFPLFACHDCLILDSISAGGGDWLTLKRSILVCGTDTAVSYGADSFIDLDTVLLYTPGSPVIHAVGTPSSFDTNLIVWQNPQLCWTGLGATVAPTSPALPANNPWAVHFGNAVGDPVCDPCCAFVTGNVDYDPGDVCDGSDLQALVDYIFFGMVEAIKCSDEADLSGDDLVDPSDLQTMIDFVFFNTDLRRSCRLFRDL